MPFLGIGPVRVRLARVEKSLANVGCQLLEMPLIRDERGSLTFIEGSRHIPFQIARIYYLYDVPGGETRAGHAHKVLDQVLIAVSGSFDVIVDNGRERTQVRLNRSVRGLRIPPGVWREIEDFSSGAVCLALASLPFDEQDYIRDYQDFLAHTAGLPL